jgi:hypothetical protein
MEQDYTEWLAGGKIEDAVTVAACMPLLLFNSSARWSRAINIIHFLPLPWRVVSQRSNSRPMRRCLLVVSPGVRVHNCPSTRHM